MSLLTYTKPFHNAPYPSISPTLPSLSTTKKVIFITGGGSGIGSHIAQSFAASGPLAIALFGGTLSSLSTVQPVTEAAYPTVKALKFAGSITDASAVSHAFAIVKEKFGEVDVLVPNAASFPEPKPIAASAVDEYSSGLEVNLQGNVIAMQAFLKNRRLREEQEAVLIHVTTAGVSAGRHTCPDSCVYCEQDCGRRDDEASSC